MLIVFKILFIIIVVLNISIVTASIKKPKKSKKLNDENADQQGATFQYDIKTIIPQSLRKPKDYDYDKENIWKYDCTKDRDTYIQNMMYSQQENHKFCKKQGKKYYDYKSLVIQEYGNAELYQQGRNIGSGHYADVYKSQIKETNDTVIIKNLKDIKVDKIKREYSILKKLGDHPNIAKLIDVYPLKNDTNIEQGENNEQKQQKDFNKLVFQQHGVDYEGEEYKALNKTSKRNRIARAAYVFDFLTTNTVQKAEKYMMDMDIRCAMYDIIKATAYTHSKGIMHRDIKPGNMVYHMTQKKAILIDFGLADYFLYEKPYHYRVATKSYKAPELLLNFTCYDYGIDTWGIGLTMSQLVFRKRPMFNGREDVNILRSIVKLHGTQKMLDFLQKYKLKVDEYTAEYFPNELPGREWGFYINEDNQQNVNDDALDLLSRLLAFDFADRISPEDALMHPYFDPIRDFKEGRNTTEVNFDDVFTESMFSESEAETESTLDEEEMHELLHKKGSRSNNTSDQASQERLKEEDDKKKKEKQKKEEEKLKKIKSKEQFDQLNPSEQEDLKKRWRNHIPQNLGKFIPQPKINIGKKKEAEKKKDTKSQRQQEYEEYIKSKRQKPEQQKEDL